VSAHLTDVEAQHRAEAVEQLLAEMRSGGHPHDFWNHPYEQLAGRTPTEALADGDDTAVRQLIDEWYAASERSAEQLRSDPAAMARIAAKTAELRARRSA
jgi:predicted amino acid dehydrogenase